MTWVWFVVPNQLQRKEKIQRECRTNGLLHVGYGQCDSLLYKSVKAGPYHTTFTLPAHFTLQKLPLRFDELLQQCPDGLHGPFWTWSCVSVELDEEEESQLQNMIPLKQWQYLYERKFWRSILFIISLTRKKILNMWDGIWGRLF